MKTWYIYLETSSEFVQRRYYRHKLKSYDPDRLKYVGKAELSEDYFITGSECKYTEIIDLDQVSLVFRAVLRNKKISEFEFTLDEMLYRAKEGILPYLSFAEHRVLDKPILKINGKRHRIVNGLDLDILQ